MADVELKPVYLLTGQRPAEGARRRSPGSGGTFAPEAVERVSALEASGAEAVALCNAGSLFGDRGSSSSRTSTGGVRRRGGRHGRLEGS